MLNNYERPLCFGFSPLAPYTEKQTQNIHILYFNLPHLENATQYQSFETEWNTILLMLTDTILSPLVITITNIFNEIPRDRAKVLSLKNYQQLLKEFN